MLSRFLQSARSVNWPLLPEVSFPTEENLWNPGKVFRLLSFFSITLMILIDDSWKRVKTRSHSVVKTRSHPVMPLPPVLSIVVLHPHMNKTSGNNSFLEQWVLSSRNWATAVQCSLGTCSYSVQWRSPYSTRTWELQYTYLRATDSTRTWELQTVHVPESSKTLEFSSLWRSNGLRRLAISMSRCLGIPIWWNKCTKSTKSTY